jgi:predicted RNA binding protein YcfA (HicA-like mRNA interferase family)
LSPKAPRLPSVTGTQLIKALRAAGFEVTRQSGSHHRLKHEDGRATTVPVHAGRDVPKGTLRSVLDDAGLSAEQFRRLLLRSSTAIRACCLLPADGVEQPPDGQRAEQRPRR